MFKLGIILSIILHLFFILFTIKRPVYIKKQENGIKVSVQSKDKKKQDQTRSSGRDSRKRIKKISLTDLAIRPGSMDTQNEGFKEANESEVLRLSNRLMMIQYDHPLSEQGINGHCNLFVHFNKTGTLSKKITQCSSPYINVNLNNELDRLIKNKYFYSMRGKNYKFKVVFDLTTTPEFIGVSRMGNIITIKQHGAKSRGSMILKESYSVLGSLMNVLSIPARIQEEKEIKIKIQRYKESEYFK